ncbi:unnamed protein product [Rotaria sordida]|uniref:Uncharacterized protein n=1 Tax=Rotaria sordida TaxID=392033 RepID=A0A815AV56_9BILA|nr:unnamed protein product [Rotaria sordida]
MAFGNGVLRFADFGALPKRMLAPIEGYEKIPLITLEEAVKPLVNIVPKVERNVKIVKKKCQESEDGLTTDESAAIMLYTYESMPHEDSLYVKLNETDEAEVLLLIHRKFQVKSCLDSGHGLHIVQLEEPKPQYNLLEPVPLPDPLVKRKNNFQVPSSPIVVSMAVSVKPNAEAMEEHFSTMQLNMNTKSRVAPLHGSSIDIHPNARWQQNGVTMTRRNGQGSGTNGETIISKIDCRDLTMDENGSLYVVHEGKHEVRRYGREESQGTVVAGGNGSIHSPEAHIYSLDPDVDIGAPNDARRSNQYDSTGVMFGYTDINHIVGFKSTNISHHLTINNSSLNKTLNLTTTTIQTIILPTILIPFLNASFYSSFNFTKPSLDIYNSLPICKFSISNNDKSIYKVTINQTLYSYDIIEKHHGKDLYPGGHYIPRECRTEQRLALIICYRNREQHLKMFLNDLHPFLQKQKLDYTIFVVNQHGNDQFNRAALFNVGYLEAMKLYQYDCFIFHDVDLLPEDLRNIYKCEDRPRHMAVAMDKFNHTLPYSDFFGGVTAFRPSDILGVNGHPTIYWGWGSEDDDMYLRVAKKLKKSIIRYPIEIARYKMIRTHGHVAAKENPNRLTIVSSNYDYNLDGINTTNYILHNILFYKLFTLINVTLPEESFEHICRRLHIQNKKIK